VTARCWYEQTFCSFDIESTGLDVFTDRIVTATVAYIRPGEQPETRSFLVDPGIDIPAAATKVHGITTEHARTHGAKTPVALVGIVGALKQAVVEGGPLVVMNASFDMTLLASELARHGMEGMPTPLIVDPFVIDKNFSWRKGKRTLTAQAEHYGVRLEGAHTAEGDALAAARVAWRMASMTEAQGPCTCHGEYVNPLRLADGRLLRDMPLGELQVLQATWAREQADSLRSYFLKVGKDASDVDGDWPIRGTTTTEPTGVPA
jgi:DNA polymerase-3 subunit epsilon